MMALLYLFGVFFRIGIFSFGGGIAMLPLIFQSVQDFGIMTHGEFSNLVALSQVTPGPVAVNAATYVGFQYAGIPGAIAATLGVSMPSFVLVLVVMKFVEKYNSSRTVRGIFEGIRPATVGLIGAAVIFVGQTVLVTGMKINIIPCVICGVSVILAGKLKLSPILLIIIMGVIGAFVCG